LIKNNNNKQTKKRLFAEILMQTSSLFFPYSYISCVALGLTVHV